MYSPTMSKEYATVQRKAQNEMFPKHDGSPAGDMMY